MHSIIPNLEYKAIEDIEFLMHERGFLSESFSGQPVISILDDLDLRFRQMRTDAHADRVIKRFWLDMNSRTNNIQLKFNFEYDPGNQKIRITSLVGSIGNNNRTFLIKENDQLPQAGFVTKELKVLAQHKKWIARNPVAPKSKGKKI